MFTSNLASSLQMEEEWCKTFRWKNVNRFKSSEEKGSSGDSLRIESKYPFVALNFDENRSDFKHVYEKKVVLKSLSHGSNRRQKVFQFP